MTSATWDIDVAVIGAGVIGLAIAARLAQRGYEVVILETAATIGSGTSSRNSEVSHAGIYYPPSSLKARFCVEGNRTLPDWCRDHGVPHAAVGKMIVATSADEADQLEDIRRRAADNGVILSPVSGSRACSLQPGLTCVDALWSPTTGIVNSHALMLSYLGEAEAHGASLAVNTPVIGGHPLPGGGLALDCGGTDPMALRCRAVVNAAGLFAQSVTASICNAVPPPPLVLAKGSYFDLSIKTPFSTLIYPVPVRGGLGVHYTVDIAGRGRFGPDVEWLEHSDPAAIDYAVDPARGDAFYQAIRRYWPALPDGALHPAYSGVRPKIALPADKTFADFSIQSPEESGVDGLFTLYGIESPGLTSSLPMADHVATLLAERL